MKRLKTRIKKINSPLTPPKRSVATGETVNWGGEQKHVYRELRPVVQRSELRHVKDPETDRPLFHPAPAGATPLPTRQRVVTIEEDDPLAYREFILDDLGNGTVKKVFTFREDPEIERQKRLEAEREARRAAVLDMLAEAPERARADLDEAQRYLQDHLGEFDRRVGEHLAAAGVAKEGEEPTASGYRKVEREAAGWFDVLDPDGDPVNAKAMREDEADALLESFTPKPPEGADEGDGPPDEDD